MVFGELGSVFRGYQRVFYFSFTLPLNGGDFDNGKITGPVRTGGKRFSCV